MPKSSYEVNKLSGASWGKLLKEANIKLDTSKYNKIFIFITKIQPIKS